MGIVIDYNKFKDQLLRDTRGIGFVELMLAMTTGGLVDVIEHPDPLKQHQHLIIVNIANYIYCCPFVINLEGWFLKTIYPSRKFTKYYLKRKDL